MLGFPLLEAKILARLFKSPPSPSPSPSAANMDAVRRRHCANSPALETVFMELKLVLERLWWEPPGDKCCVENDDAEMGE